MIYSNYDIIRKIYRDLNGNELEKYVSMYANKD